MKWITQLPRLGSRVSFCREEQSAGNRRREGAIPFDTPGAELHHRENLCTFDVIIKD